MTFGQPLLLLSLLVLPLAWFGQKLLDRRRMRYAVRFTNVEVLAGVAGTRSRLRLVAPVLLALALAALCFAVARPRVTTLAAKQQAAVILVLDISGSMQAQDVKPTRLAAARRAIQTFLTKVPRRVQVALILFAGDPFVAAPPTTDHFLIAKALDTMQGVNILGGTAIGDALELAVQLGRQIAGSSGSQLALGQRTLAAYSAAVPSSHSLVSILFLSDGHQNRGRLKPLQAAGDAKAAGFPVYTIALGTTGNTTLRTRGQGGFSNGTVRGPGILGTPNGLAPDPTTLRAIANTTGGKFYAARSAGAVQDAYSRLGSRFGQIKARKEVTDEFVLGALVLLLLAGLGSALVAPKLP